MLRLPPTTARQRALLFTVLSLLSWGIWEGARTFPHPWGDLSRGHFTDHFSHMNAARLFTRVGADIWRKPVRALLRKLDPAEMRRMPADIQRGGSWSGGVYAVPGWPEDKPLIVSWSQNPRNQPAGALLLVAPVALLYHHTSLSLEGAARLLLLLFLVGAHVALFFFFETFFEGPASPVGFLALFVVYSAVLCWTLEGFYDPACLAPLALCARYLGRRRALAALVAFCAAAALHFRALFFAPLPLYAAYLFFRDRQWRGWRARDSAAAVVAAGLSVACLYPFALLWPSLQQLEFKNPIGLASPTWNDPAVGAFLVVTAVVAVVLCHARAWLDVAVLAWLAFTFLNLRQAYPWHVVIPAAWLALPVLPCVAELRGRRVHEARMAFFLYASVAVFGSNPLPLWVQRLFV